MGIRFLGWGWMSFDEGFHPPQLPRPSQSPPHSLTPSLSWALVNQVILASSGWWWLGGAAPSVCHLLPFSALPAACSAV